ncbi:preprotein translocase subunit SecE [Candidatus Saccharibacteria bacterium QS_5_54_17]|jgi:preprotein translocase subunit SecE|nr:MAG: preprotein translocase subunit SecE [Candidatus Saccharibacteria bacterium QS_5_54_17]PSO45256.1 MAG: preprotein translocase subunit SecE [Candidatus Saccharibacteria bacterium SW_7_54_9]
MHALLKYFKESWQELEKVSWPDRNTAMRLTGAVIVLSAIVGIYIAAADFILVELLDRVILSS